MKIFERIVDGCILDIVRLSTNQYGCSSADARLFIEKHCGNQQPGHLVFLDLEEAFDFDRLQREAIWYACDTLEFSPTKSFCAKIECILSSYDDGVSHLCRSTSRICAVPLLFVVVKDVKLPDLQQPTVGLRIMLMMLATIPLKFFERKTLSDGLIRHKASLFHNFIEIYFCGFQVILFESPLHCAFD
ncbi:unnamed protein product [Heligmosomoides polygyrus]|uniref:Reverse transcriptase domain-containing protein n=1 Tax=Heligmosomoides polygyrus TaxID=6339 RepID=A0A183GUJ4_HELPZ|nr:unnamed protein product [Heligmosomoides polygyrus]